MSQVPGATPALSGYQRRLFVFLSVATFFEGYDFMALAQILPNLRADFGLDKFDAGILFSCVNIGTIVAWLIVRRADRAGRRTTMMITIVGYTIFTFLSGLAFNAWSFGICQFIARVFLIGEWATSMVMAAEEFPAARRGMVIGVLQACASVGAVLCAGVTPLLLTTTWGWRSVYFVGIIPLVLLAVARRDLKETARFEQLQKERAAAGDVPRSLFAIWQTPYRARVLQLAAIWFLTYAGCQAALSFWKDFAVTERGLTDADVGGILTVASLGSMPLVFLAGRMLDGIGRRRGAVVIFLVAALGIFLSYTLHGTLALGVGVTLLIFGCAAVLPVLNTFTTELFPTEHRADAFAWSNNLLGRIGFAASPVVVGFVAEKTSWGAAIAPTALLPLLALALIVALLPETRGRELEDTAVLH